MSIRSWELRNWRSSIETGDATRAEYGGGGGGAGIEREEAARNFKDHREIRSERENMVIREHRDKLAAVPETHPR